MVCRVDAVGAVRVGEPTEEVRGRPRRPVLPEADSFYQPPNDFERAAAGAVLRSRAVEVALFGSVTELSNDIYVSRSDVWVGCGTVRRRG